MKRLLLYLVVSTIVLLSALTSPSVTDRAIGGTVPPIAQDPAQFCAGEAGWGVDLNNNPPPPDPQCGPGEFRVDIEGELSEPLSSFEHALENLRNRGGIGTLWFQPEPTPTPTATVTPEPTEEPEPDPVPIAAPEGFCQGKVGWPVNLAADIPQNPECPDGLFHIDINGEITVQRNFQMALLFLEDQGGNGTFWYQPFEIIQAAEEFCTGEVPLVIDLATQRPNNPQCQNGIYQIDLEDETSFFEDFTGVSIQIQNLISGKVTIWFITEEQPPTEWLLYLPRVQKALVKVEATAPPEFCEGTIGWSPNLLTHVPVDPGCTGGQFRIDVGGELSEPLGSFEQALENLRSRGGKGTIWFVPS